MKLRRTLCAAFVAVSALPHAFAQNVAANVALPFYGPPAFMQGVHKQWYGPRSAEFSAHAQALTQGIKAVCQAAPGSESTALAQARETWKDTTLAWEKLVAVAIGPLIERRSLRQIDFMPTRPELIERAIRTAPADARAMERIGTPAKGLPALEWLLWTKPITPASPACRYAQMVVAEVQTEAQALASGFAALAARDWSEDEEAAVAPMSEFVNQWVGGLERLRWANMEKPLRAATTQGGTRKPPAYNRTASGLTAQAWAAEWEGVSALAAFRAGNVPQPGQDLVPIETYLRGRGLNPLASKLADTVRQTDAAMKGLTTAQNDRVLGAGRALSAVKRLAEAEVAPALEVNIGFSDADGD
ncbi:imelysin family protein [Variovorax sp. VNK109]|uniref:imelysin family protein n=1 Tax=Variovorax sp. VNK109 TaxID=3400919 RepID=UPI003C025ADD